MSEHREYAFQLKRKIRTLNNTVRNGKAPQRRKAAEQVVFLEYELLVHENEKYTSYAHR